MIAIEEIIEENMYYNMFQSCTKLTTCPDFGGGIEKEQKVSKENFNKLSEVEKFDDFNWNDNMNEAYRE